MKEVKLYTVKEVARQLRVDATTVRRWIKVGILPAILLPSRGLKQAYRIRDEELQKLLNHTN